MRSKILRLSLLLICFVGMAHAQGLLYQYDTSIKVFAYGKEQNMAWCGGFNNPQFAMGDLNNDGKTDLVVFEAGHGVKTFINTGTPGNPYYTYAPQYALNFPPIFDYLILADYNCDGVVDLFQQGNSGFSVYKGYYNADHQLCFTFFKNLFYTNDTYTNGPANAFNNPGDIPAIVDVDNDGDLDFISYNVIGGNLNWYKNMQVENHLPCDSIDIVLADRCWGKVYQAFWRAHQLQYDCSEDGLTGLRTDSAAQKTTHQGNTPCLFDYDDDGDYDYLDGSISFNEMTFLLNGRAQYGGPDSMIYQDTTWQSVNLPIIDPYLLNGTVYEDTISQAGGTPIEMPLWAAAFNVDIDQDGKKDLLIAPNAQNTSENYKCIWYYKNETTPGNPSWVFQSDTFLVDKTIDLGTAAYPMFYDYNKDGKPDLFIGSDGYYQSDGTLRSRISYYLNTSTPGNPSFTLQTNDFMGLSAYAYKGAAPAFGDINNDGKDDMVIGHVDGTVSYFENMAANDSVQPNWQLSQQTLTDMSGTAITAGGGHAAPFVYDINKDGKPDLVIGEMYGYLLYYQNNSTSAGQLNLQMINDELGGARVDPLQNLGNYSTPFIGKLDSTGIDYILMGSNSGDLYRFDGFQTGDVNATYTMIDTQYNFIDTTFLTYNNPSTTYGIYGDFRTAPAVADIDGDGAYEMIVGNIEGGVTLYKQKPLPLPQNVPTVKYTSTEINVYPNPAKDVLYVSWSKQQQAQQLLISIIDIQGQQLMQATVPSAQGNTKLQVAALTPGMYVCVVQAGGSKYYKRFTVLR